MRSVTVLLAPLAAALALAATAGCHGLAPVDRDVAFSPYGAVAPAPATPSAVRLDEAHRQALAKAGARYVGELAVEGPLEGRAESEAAKVGATHMFLVTRASEGPGGAAPRGRFALFRVDPERWSALPAELRPADLAGEPTSTTTITSAPLR